MLKPKDPVHNDQYWAKQRKKEFPLAEYIEFSVASIGSPLASDKRSEFSEHYPNPRNWGELENGVEHTRNRLGHLLKVDPSTLVFTFNATDALRAGLKSFHFYEEDEIITTDAEYGSMEDALKSLNGIKVVKVPTDNIEERIRDAVTPKTRAIMVSHVTHSTCEVLPLKEIGKIARDYSLSYIVDGAQSIGQMDIDIHNFRPDLFVASGHKWLRGTTVSGILYVPHKFKAPRFLSSPYSTHSSRIPMEDRGKDFISQFVDYDSFGNTADICQLGMAMAKRDKLGWDVDFDRIKYLGETAVEILSGVPGVEVLDPENRAPGLVSLSFYDRAAGKVNSRLESEFNIISTYKEDQAIIRVSLSPYNTVDDILDLATSLTEMHIERVEPTPIKSTLSLTTV